VKALQQIGYEQDRQRGAILYCIRLWNHTGALLCRITILLLRTIIRQAGLTVDEFVALLG
jgi:hypothetical protein